MTHFGMGRWVVPLGLVWLAAASLACHDSIAPKTDEPTLDVLLASPTVLELGDKHLLLESNLALDRMPQTPPFHGFYGEVRVLEEAKQSLPGGLGLTRIWVILGDDVWAGGSLSVLEPEAAYELRRWVVSARGWVNVSVEVVVELSLGTDRSPSRRRSVDRGTDLSTMPG